MPDTNSIPDDAASGLPTIVPLADGNITTSRELLEYLDKMGELPLDTEPSLPPKDWLPAGEVLLRYIYSLMHRLEILWTPAPPYTRLSYQEAEDQYNRIRARLRAELGGREPDTNAETVSPSVSPATALYLDGPKGFREILADVHNAALGCVCSAHQLQTLVVQWETPAPGGFRDLAGIWLGLRSRLENLSLPKARLGESYKHLGIGGGIGLEIVPEAYAAAIRLAGQVHAAVALGLGLRACGEPPEPCPRPAISRGQQKPNRQQIGVWRSGPLATWNRAEEQTRNQEWVAQRLQECYQDVRRRVLELSPIDNQQCQAGLQRARIEALEKWTVLAAAVNRAGRVQAPAPEAQAGEGIASTAGAGNVTPAGSPLTRPVPPSPADPELTLPDSPQRWAKLFGFSVDTLKRRFADGTIRHKKLTTKSYQIAVADLPALHQTKYRNPQNPPAK